MRRSAVTHSTSRSCTCHLQLLGIHAGGMWAAPPMWHRSVHLQSLTGRLWPLDRPPHAHLGERGERAVKTTTHAAGAR